MLVIFFYILPEQKLFKWFIACGWAMKTPAFVWGHGEGPSRNKKKVSKKVLPVTYSNQPKALSASNSKGY